MVFKLVRIDSEESCKILLPIGKHLIGRGTLLKCEDKRISRHHGELEVCNDAVIIKALHQNPCYVIKKDISETQVLKLNCTENVANGDRFGLLPDSYWFEVLYCTVDTDTDSPPNRLEVKQEDDDQLSIETEPAETIKSEKHSENINFDGLNESVGNDSPNSLSLLLPSDNETATSNTNINQNVTIEPKSPAKRAHSSSDENSNDIIKKVKSEGVDIKEESVDNDKQQDDEAVAGPSNNVNDKESSESNSKDKDIPSSPPPPAPPAQNQPKRERCMYGANCYRRNPHHKSQFSHPGDVDWGAGERAECPWGAACRRRDPRHWRDHTHPPGARQQLNQPGKIKRKPKKRHSTDEDDDDDDDEEELSPIQVTGKRRRTTVNRLGGWDGLSESEEDEDPYKTDGSDDWTPSKD